MYRIYYHKIASVEVSHMLMILRISKSLFRFKFYVDLTILRKTKSFRKSTYEISRVLEA